MVKYATLGCGVKMLSHEQEMTVRKLLSDVGASPGSDIRVNGRPVGLDDRIPDESIVTETPKIVAG